MRVDDLHKRCPKCGQVKALADFASNRANRDGLTSYCRPCGSADNCSRRAIRNARAEAAEHATEREARRAAEDLREAKALQGGDLW